MNNKEKLSPELSFLKEVFPQDGWEDYIRRINTLSSPDPDEWRAIDFPVEVAVELTNNCNLRCIMCPVPTLRRSRGYMEEAVFRKAVEELSRESGFLFLPQGFGEPLLHKKWSELMEFAADTGIRPVVVLTNGMLLNETRIEGFLNSVDIVVVTVDGVTAETYESVRVKGSLERVTGNIERLLTARGRSERPHIVLRIIKMEETDPEIEGFRGYWSGRIGRGDIIQIADCIDWAGTVAYRGTAEAGTPGARHPCRMLWRNLTVYHDGKVSPCCYDAEGELTVGDVSIRELREIWNSPSLKELRNLHLAYRFEEIPLCSRCRNWL